MKKLVVLTGAGMSAESGISVFRGGGGLWDKYPVEQVATPEGYAANPALVTKFYNERRKQLLEVEPNRGHQLLAEMEKYFQSLPEGTGGSNVKAKRVLELNADHAAFAALKKAKDAEPEKAKRMAMILLAQATLMAGLPLEDPSAYTELVCSLF